jgi:hypothetical protein
MNVFFRFNNFQKKSFSEYFFAFLVLTVLFSFITFFSPVSRPVLNIEVFSSVSGMSQIFFNTGQNYNEEESAKADVRKGQNSLRYQLSTVASPVRWDPFNNAGTVEIRNGSVTFFGMDFQLGEISFKALDQIGSVNVLSQKTVVHTQKDAVDPELEMTFDADRVAKIRMGLSLAGGVVVSIVVLLLLYYAKQVRLAVARVPGWLYMVMLLALINVIVFYDHIFDFSVFPWDFSLTYHAIPNYWITSLQLGQFPQWVPFQGMGYPLLMNMQSGLFYLPNYFFYVLNIPYTLHAAVIFQIVHVFLGGVGAYIFLRKSGHDVLSSTLGGVAYNLFGGFFCNSEHLDIVRSFAFLPWIFAGLIDLVRNGVKPFSIFVIPLLLLFQWTGGYPGSSISIVFVAFVFVFASALAKECSWKNFVIGGGLIIIGVLMASPAFFPVLMLKGEIARSAEAGSIAKAFVEPANLTSLIQKIDSDALPNDISMRSLHILIIPFVFVFFLNFNVFKRNVGMTAVACCSLLMGMGGVFFDVIVKLLPPLGYSRFPSADYRGFIALSIVFFAMLGYQEYKESSWSVVKDRLIRFVLFAVLSYFIVDPLLLSQSAFVFLLVSVVLVVLCLCIHRLKITPINIFVLFLVVQLVDFVRVEGGQYYWNNPVISAAHFEHFGSLESPATLLEQRVKGVSFRAERSDEFMGGNFGYRGYLSGNYMVGDYSGPMQFLRQRYIVSQPDLLSYAKKSWTPIYFKTQPVADEAMSAIRSGNDGVGNLVKLQLYKPNSIVYDVKSDSDFGFLENETYFPGWTMILADGSKVGAKDIHGFRYWDMPAGNYQAVATFKMPYFRIGIYIAIFGLAVLLIVAGCFFRFRKQS